MTSRWRHAVLLSVFVLMLSGCFRQASPDTQPIEQQPVSNTSAPNVFPTSTPEQEATPLDATGDAGDATPTVLVLVTQSTPILPVTDIPTNTLELIIDPTQDETAPTEGGGVNILPVTSPTATAAIITPMVPSGGGNAISSPTPSAVLVTPTPLGVPLVTPTSPAPEVAGECVYIVVPGDNLFRIAINNNTSLDALRAANPEITGDIIQPGDRIILSDCQPTGQAEGDGGTGGAVVPPDGGNNAGGIIHIVSAGETLAIIARQYGVTITAIAQANNLSDPNRLSIGQELVIPSS